MVKHPYEFGGILFTFALVGGLLGGIAYDIYHGFPHGWQDVVDNGVHEFIDEEFEKEWAKYVPKAPSEPAGSWSDHYKDSMDFQLECNKTSTNLQEFYDCVNNP